MASLLILKGDTPGKQHDLTSDRMVIGRQPDCDIVLDSNSVSRRHAQVVTEGGAFFVEDLGSRNGTYVNGRKIEGRAKLAENDRIKICDVLLTFHAQAPQPAQADLEPELPVTISDDEGGSTITSTLDVASASRIGLEVNPEIKLKAILEISRNLSTTLKVQELLPKILDHLFKIFPQADRGFILLEDENTKRLVPKAIKHRRPGDEEGVSISRTIVHRAMSAGEAILSADAASDSRFAAAQSIADFRIRSMMCVPLLEQSGKALGVIHIDTQDYRGQFKQEDLDLLASVASQAAISLENARMHESLIEQEHIRRDLQFAKQVQKGFLPSSIPSVKDYGFYAFYEAAYAVGGDYYDFVELPDRRLAIALGDVSGKGVPAALLMARFSSDARSCLLTEPDPAAAVNKINVLLQRAGVEDRFITFILAVLDPKAHEIVFVNAGHLSPLVRRGDTVTEGCPGTHTGLPLGVAAEIPYTHTSIKLEPGDRIVLYTDGVTEAMNASSELYGPERLTEQVRSGPLESEALGQSILQSVKQFTAGYQQSDDITLICFGRNASRGSLR